MKNLLLLFVTIVFISCQEPQKVKENIPTAYKTSTEELQNWFNAFSVPYLRTLMDSIKQEYPSLMKDIQFLDSIKGIKIDFIGMVHSSFGDSNQPIDDKTIAICQESIGSLIDTSHYCLIGTENAFTQGKITWEIYLKENSINSHEYLKLLAGIDTVLSIESININLAPRAKYDNVLKRLITKNNKPYIVGIEPRWVWLTEDIARNQLNSPQFPTQSKQIFQEFIRVLTTCRSEIAFARTARQIMKAGKDKTGVIVYGKNHLYDFHNLATKYGTVSNYILTKECNLNTN
jgi:hypothetical protein